MNSRKLAKISMPPAESTPQIQHQQPERMSGGRLVVEGLRWGLAALLGFACAALLLAMIGVFSVWSVTPVGVIAAFWIARFLPTVPSQFVSVPVAFSLFVLVAGVLIYGWLAPHEHILGGRDSGTYVATAAWIGDQGTLQMNVGDPIFDGTNVVYESIGFPSVGSSDELKPQFLHMFPSLMAYAAALSGDFDGVFLVAPLVAAIGLLGFFAFTRSLLSSRFSLFATALVTVSLPFAYFYRAPFSEALAFTFLFGGLWALNEALARRSYRIATGAGALLGAVTIVRIDGIVILLGLTAYLALLRARSDPNAALPKDSERSDIDIVDRAWKVAASMMVLATLDGAIFSPPYLSDHGTLITAVLVLVLALRFLSSPMGRLYRGYKTLLANGLTVVAGAFFIYAALVRPYQAEPTRSDIYGLEGLQRAAGVAVEPFRSYAELSVHWLVWYLGIPLVTLGLAGLVFKIRETVLSGFSPAGPLVAISATATILFVYRPSINPDHIWAMRRFVPLVIPALVILCLLLVARWTASLARWGPPAAVILGVGLALPIVSSTAQAGLQAEFVGAGHDTTAACEVLEPNSVLLFVGEPAVARLNALGPPLRGICGIGVAAEDPASPLNEVDIESIASAAKNEGRTLWVAGTTADPDESVTVMDGTYEYLGLTLFEAPRNWIEIEIHLSAWEPRS